MAYTTNSGIYVPNYTPRQEIQVQTAAERYASLGYSSGAAHSNRDLQAFDLLNLQGQKQPTLGESAFVIAKREANQRAQAMIGVEAEIEAQTVEQRQRKQKQQELANKLRKNQSDRIQSGGARSRFESARQVAVPDSTYVKYANAADTFSNTDIDEAIMAEDKSLLNKELQQAAQKSNAEIADAIAQDNISLMDNASVTTQNIPSRTKLNRQDFQSLQEQHKAFGDRMQELKKTNPGAFNKLQAQYAHEAAYVRNYEFGLQTQEMNAAEKSLRDMTKNKADELSATAMKEREQLIETIRTGRGAAANRLEGNVQNIKNMLKEGIGADGKALTAEMRAGYERAVRQGEAKAAMFKRVANGAEKASLGKWGRLGIFAVGALATTAIAGLMFRGGKQENAQLYNPNAAFQYS